LKVFSSFTALLAVLPAMTAPSFAQTAVEPAPAVPAPTFPAAPVPLDSKSEGIELSRARDSKAPAWATFASGKGALAFVAAGTFAPLVSNQRHATQKTLRTADTALTALLVTEGLKRLTHEQRPDGTTDDSFPSGHATAAFAVATMQAHFHPKQALLWYGGAALIATSRVKLKRHYWHDVVAGAAVGYVTAKIELNQSRGLLLRPFIRSRRSSERDSGEGVAGLNFSSAF
jgi:hypothetical protein